MKALALKAVRLRLLGKWTGWRAASHRVTRLVFGGQTELVRYAELQVGDYVILGAKTTGDICRVQRVETR